MSYIINNKWTIRQAFTLLSLFMVLILNRFYQTYGQMMLQRRVRYSSVQYRMTIKSYLIDNTNFVRKRSCLAFSMHYLTLATLLGHAVPVCACKMFCFTGMMHVLPKIVLTLPGAHSSFSHEKKKMVKFAYFFWNHDVWMFDILNQHDDMHQFSS